VIERDLKTTQGQRTALAAANAEEVIKLQRSLEQERSIRSRITEKLSGIEEDLKTLDHSAEIEEIENLVEPAKLTVGAAEFKEIATKARAYKTAALTVAQKSAKDFATFRKAVEADLALWKDKETVAEQEIEDKKKNLAAKGISLDLVYIKKLTADEARLKKELQTAKSWEPELKRLQKEYFAASRRRWSTRNKVAMARVGYATVASENLLTVACKT
jgi:hypothetical protein